MLRKATLSDAKDIQKLINSYANDRVMLARSLNYLYENIREFFVFIDNEGVIRGCCASHVVWDDLAEIKALAVDKQFLKRGIGKTLVKACIEEVKNLGVKKMFALTYVDKFFMKSGFKVVNRDDLPQKIWRECINCPKFPDCDEIAVLNDNI